MECRYARTDGLGILTSKQILHSQQLHQHLLHRRRQRRLRQLVHWIPDVTGLGHHRMALRQVDAVWGDMQLEMRKTMAEGLQLFVRLHHAERRDRGRHAFVPVVQRDLGQ